ncbi:MULTISPECIES: hypothetical protein [unclassified Bradyrhizobium]|uniref:hypothetical protein n=1 Tax=unclassified Bradyrhizobium TaxID=2631580 RepID=UPI0028EA7CDE|nr:MULTISPECIES: hypothetical protein [unclassified Bradyrhizobium]
MITTGNGSAKANPLIMTEIAARGLVARLLARVDILWTPDRNGHPDGRPRPGAEASEMPQRRTVDIIPEAVELYRRGHALKAEGVDDVHAKGPKADEFRAIDKRLCWSLLQRPPHMVSIFEDLDNQPPVYCSAATCRVIWIFATGSPVANCNGSYRLRSMHNASGRAPKLV